MKNSCRISTSYPLSSNWVKRRNRESYRIDGQSLTPLFQNGKAKDWRNHLYLEMGAARATVTKDWSYIAVRYTKEQIAAIKKAAPQNLPKSHGLHWAFGHRSERSQIAPVSLTKINSTTWRGTRKK